MKYEQPPDLDKESAIKKLSTSRIEDIPLLLAGISQIDDYKWVQDTFLKYLCHDDFWVAKSAINGFSDLARIHGQLDLEKVTASLKELAIKKPSLSGYVEETLEDLKIFLGD